MPCTHSICAHTHVAHIVHIHTTHIHVAHIAHTPLPCYTYSTYTHVHTTYTYCIHSYTFYTQHSTCAHTHCTHSTHHSHVTHSARIHMYTQQLPLSDTHVAHIPMLRVHVHTCPCCTQSAHAYTLFALSVYPSGCPFSWGLMVRRPMDSTDLRLSLVDGCLALTRSLLEHE